MLSRLFALSALLTLGAQAQTASFELLPPSDYNNVEAVSPNGDAVLLWRSSSDLREAVWHDGALSPVASPQCGPFDSYRAYAVSDDGVPSGVETGSDLDLWLWHGSACRAVIGPGSVRIQAVSPDGAHAAGYYLDNSGGGGTVRGGIAVQGDNTYVIPPQGPGTGVYVDLNGVSEDGSVAAGSESRAQGGPIDAVVVRGGVKTTLPVPAGDQVVVVDVAGDGTVLATAVSLTPPASLAGHYLFTDEEVTELSPYETTFGSAGVRAASAGGARVVGSVQTGADAGEREGLVWEDGIPRRLVEMLDAHGVDTAEIPALLVPTDISSDGRVIVGTTGSGTDRRVWRAVLPRAAAWAGDAVGFWDDPNRWAPAFVPDSLVATVVVARSAGHTVTLRRDEAAASLAVTTDISGTAPPVVLDLDEHTLTLGPAADALFVGSAANGYLALEGGALVVDGSVVLGGLGEAQGIVTVDGGHALTIEGGLTVADGGTDPTGSAVLVFDGSVTTAAGMILGAGPETSGLLSLSPGTRYQSTVQATSSVGSEGEGVVTVDGASASHTGPLVLGAFETGAGRVALAHGASMLTTDSLWVGLRGAGELSVASGSGLSTGPVVMGDRAGSVGSARLTGAGSRWDVVGDLVVGAEGAAVLEVIDQAFLCLGGASRVGPQGRVVTDATVRIEPLVDCAALERDGGPSTRREAASGIRTATLTVAPEATVEAAAVEVGPGGVVDGTGALAVPLTNGGTLAPGGDGALGTLALAAPLTQTVDGVLSVEVGAAGADAVTVSGTAMLDGTLRVTALPSEGPAVGQRYDVLTAGSITGAFDQIEAPDGLAVSVSATAVTVEVVGEVADEARPEAGALALRAPAPNPTAGPAALRYAIPEAGPARLAVIDAIGREVAVLVDRDLGAGEHVTRLDPSPLAPGVYLVRLVVGADVQTQILTVVR